jgi:threonine dehydrogenase-like Zn-dependent dehydrogenase
VHTVTSATAVVYRGHRTFTLDQIPLPVIGPDEMLLEVILCGVDGSELKMFNGDIDHIEQKQPLIFGDEIIGRVVDIGTIASAERGLAIGDRVTVEARWPCAQGCRNCDRGQYFLCKNNPDALGYGTIALAHPPGLWGGYATHVYVPMGGLVYKVPDALSDEAALFGCSVLANGVRWTAASGVGTDTTVVIIGPGPQGLACVLAAARAGAQVISVGLERDTARLALAAELGAHHTVAIPSDEAPEETAARIRALVGEVDTVIDVAGFAPAKRLAWEVVSQLGTITNVAVASPRVQGIDFLTSLRKELRILNLTSHPHTVEASLRLASELYESGFDLGRLVSHQFGLADAATAIDVAAYRTEESPIKVALNPTL